MHSYLGSISVLNRVNIMEFNKSILFLYKLSLCLIGGHSLAIHLFMKGPISEFVITNPCLWNLSISIILEICSNTSDKASFL